MKLVDLGQPTSSLDHVYLGCTQRECQSNERTLWRNTKKLFESRISAGATQKLPGWEKPHAKTAARSYDMEDHAKKCVESWQIKRLNNCTKSLIHVWTTITSKWKNWKGLGSCPKCARKLSCNAFLGARIGRLDILWSVSKLARAVTEWTRACEKHLASHT